MEGIFTAAEAVVTQNKVASVKKREVMVTRIVLRAPFASSDSKHNRGPPHHPFNPQRRCKNRSQGENSILSANRPMTTMTSMMAVT